MELSKYLKDYSRTIEGKQQLAIGAFAKALEIIPRQICDNAGFDATDILNKLRQKHAQGMMHGALDDRRLVSHFMKNRRHVVRCGCGSRIDYGQLEGLCVGTGVG